MASRAALDSWLSRRLGLEESLLLRPILWPDPKGEVEILDAGGNDQRFLPLEISTEDANKTELKFLKLVDLDLRGLTESSRPSLVRWRREWRDLRGWGGPRTGAIQATPLQKIATPVVLPPLYYCPEKQVWIAVVCPECDGSSAGFEDLCPNCGCTRGDPDSTFVSTEPLQALWRMVKGADLSATRESPVEGGYTLPCLTCDRKRRCFASNEPSDKAGSAGAILSPISNGPCGAVLIEPFHLPFRSYLRMLGGEPWNEVRSELDGHPAVLLEQIDDRLKEDRLFFTDPKSGSAFAHESLLLRVECLRQLLEGLSALSVDLGHPHLGLSDENVWVRLEPMDGLRPALWRVQCQLLELAPAATGGTLASENFLPPANRPPYLDPPGCRAGGEWIEGMCLPSGPSQDAGSAEFDFLPNVQFADPPKKDELVSLAPRTSSSGTEAPISGKVRMSFPELCRISIDEVEGGNGLLSGASSGLAARIRVIRDHSLTDDLFALGTLWISTLMRDLLDLPRAAKFRDELTARLQGGRAGGRAATAELEALRSAEENGGFLTTRTDDDAPGENVALDEAFLGKALLLGMRLCGALPGGFPGQNHGPADLETRTRAYGMLVSAVVDLVRGIRLRLLGTSGVEREVLRAVGNYALERTVKAAAARLEVGTKRQRG